MTDDALHIVCPHCQATNRVPPARLDSRPDCGRCHQPLFGGRPVALGDEASFGRQLQRSSIALLVDFWAPWCGPCRMMAPAYEQAAADLEPLVRVAKVDTEAVPALAARYEIRSIPTLALFAAGSELARQSGALTSPAQIVQWVRARLPA